MITQEPNNKKPYFNLELASTPSCNMACTYCFEGDELKSKSKQTTQNADTIIKKIHEMLNSELFNKTYSGICINFWGGEPSLNFNWNKRIIALKHIYPNISFFMYSNGYDFKKIQAHIDAFTEEEITNDKFRLQISWDGIDNERIDHSGKHTNSIVLRNIKNISLIYPHLNLKLKATIQPLELLNLKNIWLSFYELDKWVNKNSPESKLKVTFSPTLNYVDDFETTEKYMASLRTAFENISKFEIAYFEKHQRHLFDWFESNREEDFFMKRSTNCSAGVNITTVDYNGDISVCHGALYSPLKDSFIKFHDLNIKETDFTEKLFKTRNDLSPILDSVSDECKNCTATICYKCPIINVEQNTESKHVDSKQIINTFQKRDTRHCEIYKLFGSYDRALFKIKKTLNLI